MLFTFLLGSSSASAVNLWQEKQLNEILGKEIPEKQIRWLNADSSLPTLAIFKPTPLPKPKGAVLILPDLGYHPLQHTTDTGLMHNLPEHGWTTLTLQLPIPDQPLDAEEDNRIYKQSMSRIKSALDFLEKEGTGNIAIIGRNHSASLAASILAQDDDLRAKANALVIVDAPHQPKSDNWRDLLNSMERLPLAILDIYSPQAGFEVTGFNDKRLNAARLAAQEQENSTISNTTAKVRKLAWKKDNNHQYRQIALNNNPGFTEDEDNLIKHIRGWLQRFAVTSKAK